MAVNVIIKHQGTKYDVEVDPTATGAEFKEIVYSLTAVEPERQKILIKGGQLKDDADMGKLGLKPGQQIMMMGTPSSGGLDLARPKEKIKFMEDMTDAERAQQEGAIPSGLTNLGNTCYLNSTLQTLRSIPELQDCLAKYQHTGRVGPGPNPLGILPQFDITTQLKDLIKSMGETQEAFAPYGFIQALRHSFPQFAEMSRTGQGYAQQDAEEAWTNILSHMRESLQITGKDDPAPVPWVDRYMSLQLESKLECDEAEARERGEQPVEANDTHLKLNCHIDAETNHLRDGILAGLTEKIQKRSEVLERDVSYTRSSKIARLPLYLTVQFVRFFWRRDTHKKAKILRKVTFPKDLDILEFCTDSLKEKLIPVRDRLREVQKDEEDITRARKRRKAHPSSLDTPVESAETDKKDKKEGKKPATDSDGDTSMETYKTDAEWEEEKATALRQAKKELLSLVNQDLAKDEGANQSGLYELRAVITHQGSSADSGHYTAYVKKPGSKDPKTGKLGEEDGNWYWFNDDRVSEVPGDKIETLSGGGETHSALILLYKAVPLPTLEESS